MEGIDRAQCNLRALECASEFLTRSARLIAAEDVRSLTEGFGVSEREAVCALFCAACGLDEDANAEDRALVREYFRESIRPLRARDIACDPYYSRIRFPAARLGRWELKQMAYEPYELFVRDDLLCLPDGREIPRLGYFAERFPYPAVLEDGREWMTVTPNEIATMADAVSQARGHVVAMGLGLGYFAFRASEKEDVSRVTVVERDREVIALFRRFLLPQFPHADKVRVVCADAFDYAKETLPGADADFVFVDLWHDVSDGVELYLRMKALEGGAPHARFAYWIETSIRAFLRGLASDA